MARKAGCKRRSERVAAAAARAGLCARDGDADPAAASAESARVIAPLCLELGP